MNDLMDVRDALGQPEPPSHAAYSAARAALLRHAAAARAAAPEPARRAMAGPPPHRLRAGRSRGWRAGLLASGAALTAAAAAVAAVVATSPSGVPGATDGHKGNTPVAVSRLSARQILLAAATTAAAAPARTGAYWYLRETGLTPAWYTPDGTEYDLSPYRHAVYLSAWGGFYVGASQLTYRQIQRLPTSPAALTAWITRSFYHPSVAVKTPPPGAPHPRHALPRAIYTPPPHSEIPGDVAFALGSLLGEEPAPPAVRAAAFRALAASPDVTKLGQGDGGVMLRISFPVQKSKWPSGKVPRGAGEIRLVIDSSTLTLRAWSNYQGTSTVRDARWTSSRPPVVSMIKALTPPHNG